MKLFKIKKQGGPIFNSGRIIASGENIVAIEIDMKSKNCDATEVGCGDGIPSLWIDHDGEAIHLKKGLEDEPTEIIFPDYIGWHFFNFNICRYSLRVVLVKNAIL